MLDIILSNIQFLRDCKRTHVSGLVFIDYSPSPANRQKSPLYPEI